MKVEALPDGKYRISDGENRIELSQTSYEDVYYCCPIDNGSLFLLLNDTVLEDPNDRITLKKMVDTLGGIEPAMTVLQDQVKALEPSQSAAPAPAAAEEENPFTTSEESDFVKVTIKGAPPTEEPAPAVDEGDAGLIIPVEDDLEAAAAETMEVIDLETAPPAPIKAPEPKKPAATPPLKPGVPVGKPATPAKPPVPAKKPVAEPEEDEMPILDDFEEVKPSKPVAPPAKGGVPGKPAVPAKKPAAEPEEDEMPVLDDFEEVKPSKPVAPAAKGGVPGKPAAPAKKPAAEPEEDEMPVLDDFEEVKPSKPIAPAAKGGVPAKPGAIPPKPGATPAKPPVPAKAGVPSKGAPTGDDDFDDLPDLTDDEIPTLDDAETAKPAKPMAPAAKGGMPAKPGAVPAKPGATPAKPTAVPVKPGAPAAKEPVKPGAPGKPPVPAKAGAPAKSAPADDDFDNLPDLADDEVPVLDEVPSGKPKPMAPAAKGGVPGKPGAVPGKPGAPVAGKPETAKTPATAAKPAPPNKEMAGVGALDLKKLPPKPGAKPAAAAGGAKGVLSLAKRGPNEFVICYGEEEAKLTKAKYEKLYETCPIDTSSLFRILMAEILEGPSKAAFRKIIATAGHSKPILDALNEKVQDLDPDA